MRAHWSEACRILHALAYMVKRMDDDGLDLYFASDRTKIHEKKSEKLANAARQKEPGPTVISNLFDCLALLLEKYRQNMSAKKRLSIYIFTTGNWSKSGTPAGRIEEIIRDLVRHLRRMNYSDRRVAIQLIQFGNDPEATKRLEYLDDLKKKDSKVKMLVQLSYCFSRSLAMC